MVRCLTFGWFDTSVLDVFCLLLYLWPAGALISAHRQPETSRCHKILGSGGAAVHVNIAADAGSGCCELPLRAPSHGSKSQDSSVLQSARCIMSMTGLRILTVF